MSEEPELPEDRFAQRDGEPLYTIDVNGKRYALSNEFRAAVEKRAEGEYRDNYAFSCWWRIADTEDAADPDSNHEEGDPILVIETDGPVVPWDALDELEYDMEEEPAVDDNSQSDDQDDIDSGNGMASVPPEDVDATDDEEEEEQARPYFSLTPQNFEEIPQPDSDNIEKVPPKPIDMDNNPSLIWWIPRHPDVKERWETGEAIIPCSSWVEWNVQARADELRLRPNGETKDNSHDHFESLCRLYDCAKVGEYKMNQDVPRNNDDTSGSVQRKGEKSFKEGKWGGDNWHV